tara:strand:- start:162 stop:383 length:222 start_codon:yes stop_codon:yes gene_type:complete
MDKRCIICGCDTHEKSSDKYDIDYNNYCKFLGFCSIKCTKKIKSKELKKIEWASVLNSYLDQRDEEESITYDV